MKGIYLIAVNGSSESIVTSAVDFLKKQGKKAAVFSPVGDVFSFEEAQKMLLDGQKNQFIEKILETYRRLEKQNDFVVCRGIDEENNLIRFRLNYLVAGQLGLPLAFTYDKEDEAQLYFLTKIYEEATCRSLGRMTINNMPTLLEKAERCRFRKVTSKMFEQILLEKASEKMQRIILPEGDCERILKAAEDIQSRRIAHPVLLGNKENILKKIDELGLSAVKEAEIIDPLTDSRKEAYAQTLFTLRQKKGMTEEMAKEAVKDANMFGTLMMYAGDADGMVSGAEHTTADTIRPALQVIKTKPDTRLVSGAFLMCCKGEVKIFSDCAVNPNPTSENLVDIAKGAYDAAMALGIDPKVAFISYSTGCSGKGPDVDLVKEAVSLFKEAYPEIKADGPMQFDAAIRPEVAQVKMPESPTAGQANVLIFPDLNTGNSVYKAVQRSGEDSLAIGPVLLGLKKPVNDLSRGCTVPDIINTVAVTAVFSQFES